MSSLTVGSSRVSRRTAPHSDSWRAALGNAIGRRFDSIRAAYRVRRDIDALLALDDRMLADIGLTRWDVEYAVRHGRPPVGTYDGLGR